MALPEEGEDPKRRTAGSSSPRTLNNGSPCCGKRPRTPRSDQQLEVSIEEMSSKGEPQRSDRPEDTALPTEGDSAEEEDTVEPYAKVARSSPIPSAGEDDEDDDDDQELTKINQPKINQEDFDSKPPAKTITESQFKSSSPPPPLPLASNLREFMKPGATKLYRPRPEWYMGDQNGNPNAVRLRTRSTSTSTPIPETLPVPAAALPFPLPPGLLVAPDNGLLPDGMFDMYVDPPMIDIPMPPTVQNPSSRPTPTHTNPSAPAVPPPPEEEQIPLVSTFGRDFDPALHVTIRETATEAALALLEWGAPVEAENIKGVTPLILASQKGNVVMVKELLRRGAVPARASSNGTTAVLQAAHFGHVECLELLFQAGGVALMEMANFNHTTPLMRAAQEGHVSIVQMLLDRGASVNRRNRVQMTALMLASQRGHGEVCQVLVNHGADLDSMTAQHSTSLLLACKRGHLDVTRVLVTAGCELWVQDSRGRTARDVAQRREMKALVPLIDSNVQLDLMQRQQRRKRNYEMMFLWNLLQQERACVPLDEDERGFLQPSRQATIHQMEQELQQTKKLTLSRGSSQLQHHLPPTLPYHLSQKSTQALLRTMALPMPLVELITMFMPMPNLWGKRVGMLTKRSVINADATVMCALDLIDEILEEGGFVEACDFVQVVPPTHFASWRDWKIHCRLKCRRGGPVPLLSDIRERPLATTATVPQPKDNPSMLEMRRQVGFLQLLATRSPMLAHVLAHQPFNMPQPLIQQLITTSDIQSLVRRMGSRGVHFEAAVAMDLVMLVSRLCSWFDRERSETPYPINLAPMPQPRRRPLPLRVPLAMVGAPFQYDPYPPQQSANDDGSGRERPSAPAPPHVFE